VSVNRKPPYDGCCTCGRVRYQVKAAPLFVHCCHCRWCQRETGTSYALNALVETARLDIVEGLPDMVITPTQSGKGQTIARCPSCRVGLWSHYAGLGDNVAFVRVGTLDDPDAMGPDIHIYTESKQPWVVLPDGVPAVAQYYDRRDYWPDDSLKRLRASRDR